MIEMVNDIILDAKHELFYLENYDVTQIGISKEYVEERKKVLREVLGKFKDKDN